MRGYTLIELLITITIVVLFSGASISAYLTFSENRQLDNDARNFNSSLNKIRNKAIFLEYPEGCIGLSSFSVSTGLNASSKRSVLKYQVNCSNKVYDGLDDEVLKSSEFYSDFSIVFLPQTGNISDLVDRTIILQTINDVTKTKNVVIDKFSGTKNEIGN
jgi:prepilin-type N-terminal cleavage/methylation domain-containing protein